MNKIWMTRALHPQHKLYQTFLKTGAQVVFFPTLYIHNLPLTTASTTQLKQTSKNHWWVFSSANGVHAVADILLSLPTKIQIACVGPKTAEALKTYGHKAALVSEVHHAEAFSQMLLSRVSSPTSFHVLRALNGRTVLEDTLQKQGHNVQVYTVYETQKHADCTPAFLKEKLALQTPTDVVFASPSSVRYFCSCLDSAAHTALAKTRWHSIGPVTSAEVRKQLGDITCEANPHTLDGFVQPFAKFVLGSTSGIIQS